MVLTLLIKYLKVGGLSMRCGIFDDLLMCLLTKVGSEMRVFYDLLTHLNHKMVFMLRQDRTSVMRSFETNCFVGNGELD